MSTRLPYDPDWDPTTADTRTSRGVIAATRTGTAALVTAGFVALLWVLEVVDTILGNRLDLAGIQPRDTDGLDGILWAPLLHGGWAHLAANTIPLLIFGFLIALSGIPRWVAVTALVWLIGGTGTWLTGAPHTIHIGASVLAFGWLVYLLVRGVFSRSARHILLGVILLTLYGGLLYGVLPGQPGISWQGHLFGALGGGIAAWRLGQRDRKKRSALVA